MPSPAVRHREASPITRERSSADTEGREDGRCKGPGGEREAELTGSLESYLEWILSCFLLQLFVSLSVSPARMAVPGVSV